MRKKPNKGSRKKTAKYRTHWVRGVCYIAPDESTPQVPSKFKQKKLVRQMEKAKKEQQQPSIPDNVRQINTARKAVAKRIIDAEAKVYAKWAARTDWYMSEGMKGAYLTDELRIQMSGKVGHWRAEDAANDAAVGIPPWEDSINYNPGITAEPSSNGPEDYKSMYHSVEKSYRHYAELCDKKDKEIQSLTDQLNAYSALDSEYGNVVSRLADLEEAIGVLEMHNKHLTSENKLLWDETAIDNEIGKHKATIDQLQNVLKGKNAKLKHLKHERYELFKANKKLTKELTDMEDKYYALEDKYTVSECSRKIAVDNIIQLGKDKHELQLKLSEAFKGRQTVSKNANKEYDYAYLKSRLQIVTSIYDYNKHHEATYQAKVDKEVAWMSKMSDNAKLRSWVHGTYTGVSKAELHKWWRDNLTPEEARWRSNRYSTTYKVVSKVMGVYNKAVDLLNTEVNPYTIKREKARLKAELSFQQETARRKAKKAAEHAELVERLKAYRLC